MSLFYYNPEKHGLEVVAEIDYSDGCFCFDLRVVWRDLKTGRLLSGRDSGCSCPSPFDQHKIEDLQEVTTMSWLKEEYEEEVTKKHNITTRPNDWTSFKEAVERALSKETNVG